MKFLQTFLDPTPSTPIVPSDGAVSVLSGSLTGIDDGAVAFADVCLQGLGPNTARVHVTLVTPGYAPSSGIIDHAIMDVRASEYARIHVSGAAGLSSGAAAYEVFVRTEDSSVQVYGADLANETPMTKLVIFGGFTDGS